MTRASAIGVLGGLLIGCGIETPVGNERDAGSPPTDGGACGPANCAGCCQDGVCSTGATAARCGQDGQTCQACGTTQSCIRGGCQVCTGCLDPSGACLSGASVSACGAGGNSCQTCPAGQVCANGQCAPACGPGSCSGCCAGNACLLFPSQSDTQCGSAGAVCDLCSTGLHCQSGACAQAPQGCGVGTNTPCLGGCCNGTGPSALCMDGTLNTSCGSGGVACEKCGLDGINKCLNQACRPPDGCGPGTSLPCANGCCTDTLPGGTCLPGNTNANCGTGGAICSPCNTGAGASCVGQACR